MQAPPFALHRLGRVPYREALAWQRATAAAVRTGAASDALAMLEHPPVYTLGAGAGRGHVVAPASDPRMQRAEIVRSDRGGDVTFHGPGQLVLYVIANLRRRGLRPLDHVRRLEAAVVGALAQFGIRGRTVAGRPGVWIGPRKIAALGVSVRGGVTMHGAALNVTNDLAWFGAIVPCGLHGLGVTSMACELPAAPAMADVHAAAAAAFGEAYDAAMLTAAGTEEQTHGD